MTYEITITSIFNKLELKRECESNFSLKGGFLNFSTLKKGSLRGLLL